MEPPDLQFGQGWSNALRKSETVTRRVLEEAPAPDVPDAFVVEAESPEGLIAELGASAGAAEAITWQRGAGADRRPRSIDRGRRPRGQAAGVGESVEADRLSAGNHEDRRGRGLDRVVAGGAEGHLPLRRLRTGADDEEVDRAARLHGDAAAERRGEAVGRITGGGVALVDEADRVDADRRAFAKPGRGDGDRGRPAEEEFVG